MRTATCVPHSPHASGARARAHTPRIITKSGSRPYHVTKHTHSHGNARTRTSPSIRTRSSPRTQEHLASSPDAAYGLTRSGSFSLAPLRSVAHFSYSPVLLFHMFPSARLTALATIFVLEASH
ncbi:hypothetical protein BJ912DRAFT_1148554 [Pholiota molesta]|nr:hypothetical protein BJ912DRAFT_1148554 [Pholiota molesta]